MNPHDRSQFDFIMSLSDQAFDRWSTTLTDDDISYAIELIQTARHELFIQEQELLDELVTSDFAEANEILRRFRL